MYKNFSYRVLSYLRFSICRDAHTTKNFTARLKVYSNKFSTCMYNKASQYEIKSETDTRTYDERMKELLQWVEKRKVQGKYVPKEFDDNHYKYLLDAKTVSQREKHLLYLLRKERFSQKDKIAKEKAKLLRESSAEGSPKGPDESHLQYGVWRCSMFIKSFSSAITNSQCHRLASAMIYGQPLVLDLGFEEHMNMIERNILSREIKSSLVLNRKSKNPFNLAICNANFQSETISKITKALPEFERYPMIFSSKSYFDIFPQKEFIYLSPDAQEKMEVINPEIVYIIGGIVDHSMKQPLTLEKAEKEGIRTQKLPVDKFVGFESNNHVLDIPLLIAILLKFQETGNWEDAFNKIKQDRNFPKLKNLLKKKNETIQIKE